MTYSITKREISPQRVILMRRRVRRTEIASAIAEMLPKIFVCAQRAGIALAGVPFTRYPGASQGLMTMETGMPVAASTQDATLNQTLDEAGIFTDTLPGGLAAFTMHTGPYDNLHDAYVAIETWMEEQDLKAAGAPWESYVTDPGDYPDPKDWKTEVFWPLAR